MKTKENKIQKGNDLIDSFMNREPVRWANGHAEINYHNDLNWLMPVVEHIRELKSLEKDSVFFSFHIDNIIQKISIDDISYSYLWQVKIKETGHYHQDLGTIALADSESLIKAIWHCVIDFINYYNKNIKK